MVFTINPATGEKIKDYKLFTKDKLFHIIKNADESYKIWSNYKIKYRCSLIANIGKYLLKNKRNYAKIITMEMGKPIKESIAEIEKCAWLCDYYSKSAEEFLKDEAVKTEHKFSFITFEPLGKVLAIMPWNFPFWQVMRCAIPALCAGNVVILKHSSVTLGCSLEIEKLFRKFLNKGVFQTVITDRGGVSYLMDKVNGISLTGSVETGRMVAENSGRNLKKIVLELGGSDPFIVLDDTDINFACENAVKGRLLNSGQSCIAAKRFIVTEKNFDEFLGKLVSIVSHVNVGNPFDEINSVGPLARAYLRENVERQVNNLLKEGAHLLYGGMKISGSGYYYKPTILVVNEKMNGAKEEIFGPVFLVFKAKNNDDAIKIANSSEFGLGASIWTRNIKHALDYAKKIESGVIFINGTVRSDPRLPFGGMKNSGFGRELGRYGILEFCNIKSVVADKQ